MLAPAAGNGQTEGELAEAARSRPLQGGELLQAFAAASAHLSASAKAIDAINVYPVPDGDTGSNMAATLREAVDAALLLAGAKTVPVVLAALAKGALYGARGNSGVILSQALRGLAAGVQGEQFDGSSLAQGLAEAARSAYRAVATPVEGTMLTVLRRAAEGAAAAGGDGPCLPTLRAALAAAEEAEAATIDQLPALREAGVPDSGGEGVCVILRGLLAALVGEAPPGPIAVQGRPVAQLAVPAGESFGFCTEFVLERRDLPLDIHAVRVWAAAGSNRSVVVVGDESALRVHVHADDGELVLAQAAALGVVSRAKLEDIGAQHEHFRLSGSGAGQRLGVLAMSRGEGFDRLFESLGAAVAGLGDVAKPSAREIAAAAERLGKADVIVLPNHVNVLLAAKQAAELARATLHVLPTETLPQGIAAALAFDAEASLRRNLQRMGEAAAAVTTVEVTTAAADRSAGGVAVRAGQAIALVDGSLKAARSTARDALLAGLEAAGAGTAALLTLFAGEGYEGELEAAAGDARARFPGLEVDPQVGRQALYSFIASLER